MEKIKILIADDHAVFRQGTRRLLEDEPDLEVVGEAGDGEEAVTLATELGPDVAIIDIAMPTMDGIAATKKIKSQCPDVKVLILSAYDDDQFAVRLLQAGAAGYLLKSGQSRELIAAIRTVSQGDSVLHPTIARKVLNQFVSASGDRPKEQKRTGVLSQRETQFLTLMSRGLSNKDIAAELGISVRTVQSHLRHIFRKLGVNSRTEAVVYALRENLLALDDVSRAEPTEKPRF